MSLLKKMRGDKEGWYKVSDLPAGAEIAVPRTSGGSQTSSDVVWDEIVSITPVGREQVFDIEVEGTHNFVGNDIFAHNTYVVKSGDLTANAPDEVLTADHTGVDLAKLATHTLADVQDLAARFAAEDTKLVSLETRVEALETGAVSSAGNVGTGTFGTGLASAFNAFGAFIKNGIAQFNTLVFQRLVAATDSTGASSAGSVNVLKGNTVAQVTNSLVLPSTKVFVTFNSQITGSWWVSDKTAGSFRVVLSTAQTGDVSFDYFLVQTEGQIATSTPEVGGSQTSAQSAILTSSTDALPPVIATSTPDTAVSASDSGSQTSSPDSGSLTSSDSTAPVVTLNGSAALAISQGSTFTDPGATAIDDVDGDLTAKIVVTGSVDTTTAGVYTLTYTATDAEGNVGTVSRVVTVTAPSAPAPAPAPDTSSPNPAPADTTPAPSV